MTERLFPGTLALFHELAARTLSPGDTAVDATAGNGHDTVCLARAVGPQGRVYAYDVQPEALERTGQRLVQEGLRDRVVLVPASHEDLTAAGPEAALVIFNLGYLPGASRTVTTRPAATLRALRAAMRILQPGGLILLTVYPGHPAGRGEDRALSLFCRTIDPAAFDVVRLDFPNRPPQAPYGWILQKRKEET